MLRELTLPELEIVSGGTDEMTEIITIGQQTTDDWTTTIYPGTYAFDQLMAWDQAAFDASIQDALNNSFPNINLTDGGSSESSGQSVIDNVTIDPIDQTITVTIGDVSVEVDFTGSEPFEGVVVTGTVPF